MGSKNMGKVFSGRVLAAAVVAAGTLSGAASAFAAGAEAFPSKPITIIVNYGAGGATDLPARKIASYLEKKFNKAVVVENKTGGAGAIGLSAVAKADPDGHTIGAFSYSPTVIAPHTRPAPFDTTKDFSFVAQIAEYAQLFCVLPTQPWRTLKDSMDYARANPGGLTYSTVGAGSGQHIFMEALAKQEKLKLAHVPFVGGSQGVAALLGGHVKASLDASLAKYAISGECRPLAVVGNRRHPATPDVPTFAELGYTIDAPLWLGLAGPAGIPEPILKKLSDAVLEATRDPGYKELLNNLVLGDVTADYKTFGTLVLTDYKRMGEVINDLGFARAK
jgi:tripartite-type tricarboxylate transporter receptor subunit TctC